MKEKLNYNKYQQLEKDYLKKVNFIARLRLILFITCLITFIIGSYYYQFFKLVSILSLIGFIILVIIHDYYYQKYDYYNKYKTIIISYLNRENNTWKNFNENGEEYLTNDNLFLKDLDIIGPNSLFQYLNTCKTKNGKNALYQLLSGKKLKEKSLLENQEAIKEISNNPNFAINLGVYLSIYEAKNIDLEENLKYLKDTTTTRTIDKIVVIITSISIILLLLLCLIKILPINYFYGLFLFNFIISNIYIYIFQENYKNIDITIKSYGKIEKVFQYICSNNYNSKKLIKYQKDMKENLSFVKKLEKLDNLNSLKNNIITNFLLNGCCCLNIIINITFSNLIQTKKEKFILAIKELSDLEALTSLATIGIIKKEKILPEIITTPKIEFTNLKHPLINESICVGNDFKTESGVNIITGSNMGGKTTFLRTIGINLILMNAGTYVCASSFKSTYLKIFTSMRIADNLTEGISTFYGELLRIKEAMNYLDKGNMIVLVDEIFKGTNYQDRIYGAKEVIKKLTTKNCIALITTHDFELCDSAKVHNYYVKETYEEENQKFDYKIRPGKSTSTNAKYLMKKLGIIDK